MMHFCRVLHLHWSGRDYVWKNHAISHWGTARSQWHSTKSRWNTNIGDKFPNSYADSGSKTTKSYTLQSTSWPATDVNCPGQISIWHVNVLSFFCVMLVCDMINMNQWMSICLARNLGVTLDVHGATTSRSCRVVHHNIRSIRPFLTLLSSCV